MSFINIRHVVAGTSPIVLAFMMSSVPFQSALANSNYKITHYDLDFKNVVDRQVKANAQTDKTYDVYIHSDGVNLDSGGKTGTSKGAWNVRGGAGSQSWKIGQTSNGQKLTILGSKKASDGSTWYQIRYDRTWKNASPEDVAHYLNPNNVQPGTSSYYQFLNLSETANLSAQSINNQLLNGKGALSGQGQAFITAAKSNRVNEIYLVSHALLETGNGSSPLAKGIQHKGKTVYNMYGIGAFDGNAEQAGAAYAYNQGWFTKEEAIIGGAKFVGNNYISKGQNTLYKMRWNPDAPATHQYATDIGWAEKQTSRMASMYNLVDDYTLHYDIPQYNNQPGTAPDYSQIDDNQKKDGTPGTTTANLNVRSEPSTSANRLTLLSSGTKLTIISKQNGWYQIHANGVDGWVSAEFVKVDASAPPENNNSDKEQVTDDGNYEVIGSGTTTARLNLRSSNKIEANNIVTTLNNNTKVDILEKSGSWLKVSASGKTGWVSAQYVKTSSASGAPSTPKDEATSGDKVISSGTTMARLNLRSSNKIEANNIITTLNNNSKVEILEKSGSWLKVKAGSRTGWVSAQFVKTSAGSGTPSTPKDEATSGDKVFSSGTTTARLNLRSSNKIEANNIITTLNNNSKVEILEKSGSWLKVKAGSRTGWVSAQFVKTGSTAPATPNQSADKASGTGTTTVRLNLRSSNKIEANNIVTTLNNNSKVEILEKSGSWLRVKAGSRTGWVSAQFVKTGSTAPTAPTQSADKASGTGTTTARLNLRSSANVASNNLITTLNNNQQVEILEKSGSWLKVKAGSRTGWVSAQFVKTGSTAPAAPTQSADKASGTGTTTARLNLRSSANVASNNIITTLNNNQQVEILEKSGSWLKVKAGSRTGWVSAQFVKTGSTASNTTKAPTQSAEKASGTGTTTARLNLRSSANVASNNLITTLNNNQQVEILEKSGSWLKVKADSRTGWVSAQFVKTGSTPAAPKQETKKEEKTANKGTTTARLNLRSSAKVADDNFIVTLKQNEEVEILEKQGNWYKVKAGSQTGWVTSEFVKAS
ncbi:SH3 domain-containing protein [Alkalicoccobacillus murimartini]|uniref:Beta-N-acetylglucosaminidase/SH3-like domain-containing protein n=1 Tax=Alkalicoccobacillus murimartini TaxID=171685 RepID=A0ABT9YH21_9BACI|nr:SH3 domain-containing protein [Alkalicoccobacillus murimartini]MDQ0206790.1 beta-N-acetylglucosaminidase/SH3-like domain-containing protein [Alkalicoccobacillus murimartini]